MKAIVHIGQPKAGSSSIQEFLQANRAALASQGVIYKRSFEERLSHYELALMAMARTGKLLHREEQQLRYKATSLKEQEAQIKGPRADLMAFPKTHDGHTAVFSSEHIMPWLNTPKKVTALDDLLREVFTEVRYVIYFRKPSDMVVSHFSEYVKRGASLPFAEFLALRSENIDHLKLARRWRRNVGEANVILRMLDRDLLKDGDLIADFCDICGIDTKGLEQPPYVNESLSTVGVEVMRHLNSRIPEIHPDSGHNPLRYHLLDRVIALTGDYPKFAMSPDEQAMFLKKIEPWAKEFYPAFFPGYDWTSPGKSQSADDLSGEALQSAAAKVLVQLIIDLRTKAIPSINMLERGRVYCYDEPLSVPPYPFIEPKG